LTAADRRTAIRASRGAGRSSMPPKFPADGKCGPPGDIWSDPADLAKISKQAEAIIFGDYQQSKAAIGAIDIFFDPGNARVDDLIEFIGRNSFGKPVDKVRMRSGFLSGIYAVPDIVSSRGALGKSEHYEIKPNSSTGATEGRGQVARFQQLNRDFNLLFFAGTEYDPVERRVFSVVDLGLLEITLEMHWFRDAPGLVLYEFCSKVKKKDPKADATKIMLLLLLGFLFMRMLKNNPGSLQPEFVPAT
jgi:hypothetical protein